ncbi:MAG TPA: PDZ domain-containing protein [Chloroflexi bacterium]|nr:PDZ domain-containing protein [Chloroflexota bacterium]
MNSPRKYRYLLFFSLFLFTAVACQLASSSIIPDQSEANQLNQDEIVAIVAATVEARQAETIKTLAVEDSAALTAVQDNPANSIPLQDTFINIYNKANPAVVHIFVFDGEGFLLGTGSGFVFDNEGHIVTNNHVVENADTLEVVFASGERRFAEVAGTDVDSDLAVIAVDSLPDDVQPLPVGDSSQLQEGQFVVAIGNPFGEAGSMSIGVISALGRTIESQRIAQGGGRFSIPQVIQTDAAINPGNSGGPLLNLAGEVVGVNSAIFTRTGANSGVGFSIPSNAVRNIAPALIKEGAYVYPYIGISMYPEVFTLSQLEQLGLPPNGVYVTGVQPDAPADKAGLIGNNLSAGLSELGDYIRAIDGVPVKSSDDLLSYLVFETVPGQTVELTILRNGEEITLPLTLGERP